MNPNTIPPCRVVCVDFDGVIVRDAYPAIGEPMPGVFSALRAIYQAGHKIIISTCRCGAREAEARRFIVENDIRFDAWNNNLAERSAEFGGGDPRKISADLYVDDKNVGGFPGWRAVLEELGIERRCSSEKQIVAFVVWAFEKGYGVRRGYHGGIVLSDLRGRSLANLAISPEFAGAYVGGVSGLAKYVETTFSNQYREHFAAEKEGTPT